MKMAKQGLTENESKKRNGIISYDIRNESIIEMAKRYRGYSIPFTERCFFANGKANFEEILADIKTEKLGTIFIPINGIEMTNVNILKYIMETCASCGLWDNSRFEKDGQKYIIGMSPIYSQGTEIHLSIFDEIIVDIYSNKQDVLIRALSVTDNRINEGFPSLVYYESWGNVLKDMISATVFIQNRIRERVKTESQAQPCKDPKR